MKVVIGGLATSDWENFSVESRVTSRESPFL